MTLRRLLSLSYTLIITIFIITSGVLLYLNFTFDQETQMLTETVVLEVRLKNLNQDIKLHVKRLSGYYSDERKKKIERDLESYERIIESLDTRIVYEDSLRIYDQVASLSRNYIDLSKSAVEGIEEGKKEAVSSLLSSLDKIQPSLETLTVQLISEEVEYLHKRQGRLTILSLDSIRIGIVVYGVGIIISIYVAGRFFNRITGFINRFNKEMHNLGHEHQTSFKRVDEKSEFGFLVEEYKALQERVILMKKQKEEFEKNCSSIQSLKEEIKAPVIKNMMAISTLLDMTEETLETYQRGHVPHITLEAYLKDMIWGLEVMLDNENKENALLKDVPVDSERLEITLSDFYEDYTNKRHLESVVIRVHGEGYIPMSFDQFTLWNDTLLIQGMNKMTKKKHQILYEIYEKKVVVSFKGLKGALDPSLLSETLTAINPWVAVEVNGKVVTLYI